MKKAQGAARNIDKDFISSFVKKLNEQLRAKGATGEGGEGFLKKAYFNTCDHNRQSEANSRVHAVIAMVCHDMGLNVEIERSLGYRTKKDGMVRFKPDVIAYRGNRPLAFIEYESTNSSDSRFFDKKRPTNVLPTMERYANDEERKGPMPPYWVTIFTLPRKAVGQTKWHSHEYNKGEKEFKRLIASPYEFYFPTFIKQAKLTRKNPSITSRVCLINIDEGRAEVELDV